MMMMIMRLLKYCLYRLPKEQHFLRVLKVQPVARSASHNFIYFLFFYLMVSHWVLPIPQSKDDIFYAELSSQPINEPVMQNCPDSAVDSGHNKQTLAKVNSLTGSSGPIPDPLPSVYVRLPAVDSSIPYADSCSSSSPSQYTGSTSQMVHFKNQFKKVNYYL